jgi:hypothetical protein
MNKKVLVTVSGGVPTIYADHDVDAVVLDYDNAKDTHPDDMIPIHLEYLPLMKFAKAIGHWPLTDDGRINDAKNLPDTTWKLLSKERPPIAVRVECVLKPEFAHGLLGTKFLWLHNDGYWKGESISNLSQTFPFGSVLAWAPVREFSGDCHGE